MAQFKQVSLLKRLLSPGQNAVAKFIQRRPVSVLSRRRKFSQGSWSVNSNPQIKKSQPSQYSTVTLQPGGQQGVKSVSLDTNGKNCYITWEDGFQSKFHTAWLRHNCHCEECRHPNGQKLLDPVSAACIMNLERATVKDKSLMITWSGIDGVHNGEIPLAFLRAKNYNRETILQRQIEAKCKTASEIPTVSYHDITSDKNWHLRWVQQINEDGISLVKGVPLEEDSVFKVAQLIGPVITTIYGELFDVEVTPDPINVAYSSLGIGLHQDLAYFESPPGLQLLHCLEFEDCVEGGENIFLDVFDVADKFRVTHPDLFHTLTTIPATFEKVHYHRDLPVHIVNQKPHIKLNHLGEIVAVYWSPPFEGALAVAEEDVEKYFLAYGQFAKILKNSKMLGHRLQPGELVIFNNLRMLHGRNTFKTNGGARRLKGCYVNIDIFKSRAQVLNNLVGDGRLAKRVGNQCWF